MGAGMWIFIGIIALLVFYYMNPQALSDITSKVKTKIQQNQTENQTENMTNHGQPIQNIQSPCLTDISCNSIENCKDGNCVCIEGNCWK